MKKSKISRKLFLFILEAAIILNIQGISVWAETVPLESETETPAEESVEEGPEMAPTEEAEPEERIEPKAEPEEGTGPEENTGKRTGKPLEGSDNLSAYQVHGMNPEQAVVNLFDYWQYAENDPAEGNEKGHDYWLNDENTNEGAVTTYNLGISKGHLLRFGYRNMDKVNPCKYCADHEYGIWNQYNPNGPTQEIVKAKLDEGGYPCLNFGDKPDDDSFFGYYRYVDDCSDYINDTNKTESLAYLFSPQDADYKKCYRDVQGMFLVDRDGYYYYDSTKNFAELDAAGKSLTLYTSPGIGKEPDLETGSSGNYGQFFPFNHATEVFDTVYTDGQTPLLGYEGRDNTDTTNENYQDLMPVDDSGGTGYKKCYAPGLNHYLGMTLEVPFLQPAGGRLPSSTGTTGEAMSFEFSGDDDVWIFIDGVLVADLGGLHDAAYLRIDFSTGDVYVQDMDTPDHTLLESFQTANNTVTSDHNPGGIAFTDNRFADNTIHTLKMFYLERGHMASNLYLKFNLQIARYNQIKKVDQSGDPLPNVQFDLYPAAICQPDETGSILCTNSSTAPNGICYVKQTGASSLRTLTTDAQGIAEFTNYSFSQPYYILHETSPPSGYRPQPVNIVLEYDSNTGMLNVANRWETGSYASFTSYVNEPAGATLNYAQYDYSNGNINAISGNNVSVDALKSGLILAVPMLERGANDWLPLYGSNIKGFHTTITTGGGNTSGSMEWALLKAALNQCLYAEGWYLSWNDQTRTLEGCLSDLPGQASRYRHVDPGGDMQMAYIMIEENALQAIGITNGSSDEKYRKLKAYVQQHKTADDTIPDSIVNNIFNAQNAGSTGNINLLDTKQFVRVFCSLIYISNEQRELRVLKVDKNEQPLDGATFGIYKTEEGARQELTTELIASGTTKNGILVFTPQAPVGQAGSARIVWSDLEKNGRTYYLKEISAPAGYEPNDTVIPIVIGTYSIYADAGKADDGVWVRASVGHLFQTMTKYATSGDVNITLRDINAIKQEQDSGSFQLTGWKDSKVNGQNQIKALHYGMSTEPGIDYGLHNEDVNKGIDPFFETDTGYLRVRVTQNGEALNGGNYDAPTNARWVSLGNTDLTGLFSLLNIVVVEDRSLSPAQRELRVLKVDENDVPLNGAKFGLYSSEADAESNDETKAIASGVTATVNGQDGVLIFQEQLPGQLPGQPGIAWVQSWTEGNYYLKEISAPAGYQANETIIPIVVEGGSVYADAGTADNGVSVRAGVGCLNEKKYVINNDTLRDILAYAQSQASGDFSASKWKDSGQNGDIYDAKALHYGMNPKMGMDYGLHDEDADKGMTPFFETDTGFIRTRVVQDQSTWNSGKYGDGAGQGDTLTEDPTQWFSQLNIVVVKNEKTQNPNDDPEKPGPGTGPDPDTDPNTDPGITHHTDPRTGPDTDKGNFPISFDVLVEHIGMPKTGDDSLIWWWALLCVVSLLGIGATVCNLILVKRKQKSVLPERKQKKHSAIKRQRKHHRKGK